MSRFHALFGLMPWPRYAGAYKPKIYGSAYKMSRYHLRDGRVFVEHVQCPACRGQGEVCGPQQGMPWFQCRYCEGSGVVSEQKALDFEPIS